MLKPVGGKVLVEIEFGHESRAAEIKKRSGLIISNPKKAGIPTTGWIFAIADNVDVPFKVGDHIIFNEPKPSGFHHDGKRLLALQPDQIVGKIEG